MKIEKIKALTSKRYQLTPLVVEQVRDMGNTFNEVVKTHLLTELFLEELIKIAAPEVFEAFKALRLTYKQKLDFSSNIMLVEDFPLLDMSTIGSLRKLNKMRNEFSHKLGHSVSDEEIQGLYGGHISCVKELYGGELLDVSQNVAMARYLFYIFGSMFPKYEFEESV